MPSPEEVGAFLGRLSVKTIAWTVRIAFWALVLQLWVSLFDGYRRIVYFHLACDAWRAFNL